MLPTPQRPTPGEVLRDLLRDRRMSQTSLAASTGLRVQHVNQIVKGRRRVTARTALLFSRALRTKPEFWLQLQAHADLAGLMNERRRHYDRGKPARTSGQ